jgi:hypothetical protein
LSIIDLPGKSSLSAAPPETGLEAPIRAASATAVERLEQMMTREVVTIRQAGAQSLGVTLKLDSNTQLFLELTSHNGLVQASVRCERGQFAPDDSQWTQLQQSLARQNVELLPMTGGSNPSFQPSAGRDHGRPPAMREDGASAGSAPQPAQPRNQKQNNRSRKRWESWA